MPGDALFLFTLLPCPMVSAPALSQAPETSRESSQIPQPARISHGRARQMEVGHGTLVGISKHTLSKQRPDPIRATPSSLFIRSNELLLERCENRASDPRFAREKRSGIRTEIVTRPSANLHPRYFSAFGHLPLSGSISIYTQTCASVRSRGSISLHLKSNRCPRVPDQSMTTPRFIQER